MEVQVAVDWDAVERRAQRQSLLGLALFPLFIGSLVVLQDGWAFWKGSGAWLAASVLFVLALVGQVVARLHPRLCRATADAQRMQYAIRHQVDPGPGLRAKTDVQARRMADKGWMAWLFLLAPAALLVGARWDRPLLTVPAAVILVSLLGGFWVWWRRQTAACARWNAEPPGPPREPPPVTRFERWTSGRRYAYLLAGCTLLAFGTALGLALALAD